MLQSCAVVWMTAQGRTGRMADDGWALLLGTLAAALWVNSGLTLGVTNSMAEDGWALLLLH